jgi:DNA-directed RNA polymerase subunit D
MDENKFQAVLKTNESLANAIRRSINKIPILAIEDVEIHRNDSALYDENLAHRLGLIPLKSNRKLDEIKEGDKITTKNQIQITLKAKGPKTVYSEELKGDVEMLYEKMPLIILDKNQEVELIAFAQLGEGERHAKFSPGLTYYRNINEIKIKNEKDVQEIEEKLKGKIVKEGKLNSKESYSCVEDEDYLESIFGDKLEITPSDKIAFFIESWGQLKPKEIFNEAVKKLNQDLKNLIKKIK